MPRWEWNDPGGLSPAQAAGGIILLAGLGSLASTGQVTMLTAMATLALSSTVKVTGHLLAWRHPHASLSSQRASVATLYREALPFLGLSLLDHRLLPGRYYRTAPG